MYKHCKNFSHGNKFGIVSPSKFLRDKWNYLLLKSGYGEQDLYMGCAGKTELSHDLETPRNDRRWFIPEKLEKLYEVL